MEEAFEKIIPEVPFAVEVRMAYSWKSQDLNGFLQGADGSRRKAMVFPMTSNTLHINGQSAAGALHDGHRLILLTPVKP